MMILPDPNSKGEPPHRPSARRVMAALLFIMLIALSAFFYNTFPFIAAFFAIIGIFTGLLQVERIWSFFEAFVKNIYKDIRHYAIALLRWISTAKYWFWRYRWPILTTFLLCIVITNGVIIYNLVKPPVVPRLKVSPSNFDPLHTSTEGDVGISVGRTAFDVNRLDGQLKIEAARALQNKDAPRARVYWNLAKREEEGDAEPLIYLADQDILDQGDPYITVIVVASLSGDANDVATGRDILKGAYVLQKQYNDPTDTLHKLPGNMQIYLIVANIGTKAETAKKVAQRIVNEANSGQEKNLIGIMGQLTKEESTSASLEQANLPLIASTQLVSDDNTFSNKYLLSVAPSIHDETAVAAQYAWSVSPDVTVPVISDANDPESSQLAQAFEKQFRALGGSVDERAYTTGGGEALLQPILNGIVTSNNNVKLIYFPEYPDDARTLLALSAHMSPNVQILGGDVLYQFVHNDQRGAFTGLRYTAFAFHDEWNGQMPAKPEFFDDFASAFDPRNQHVNNVYNYQLPTADSILSYDALSTLAYASSPILEANKSSIRPTEVWQRLKIQLSNHPFQGVSGCIGFAQDGQPLNKAVVLLQVSNSGNRIVLQAGSYSCANHATTS